MRVRIGLDAPSLAAACEATPDGIEAVLPAAHRGCRRLAVLAENQLAIRLESPPHLTHRLTPVWDGAQGAGQQHGVDAVILQRDLLAGKIQPLDRKRMRRRQPARPCGACLLRAIARRGDRLCLHRRRGCSVPSPRRLPARGRSPVAPRVALRAHNGQVAGAVDEVRQAVPIVNTHR
ncbi:MAG: hypothetical protein ACI9DC_004613 [Gammaproteobacteria bacterium]|jgi:hypothetical protein